MRSVSIRLEDMNRMEIVIGKVAENLHTQVNFDCKKMFDAYPDAVPTLSVMNPAGVCYPAIVERDGDIVTWNVTDGDLVKEGTGEVQLSFIVGETVAKSYIGRIKVTRSLVANGEAPDPVQNWLDKAEAALNTFPAGGSAGQVLTKKTGEDYDAEWKDPQGGGGGGTSDYEDLENKPSINGTTLEGEVSLEDLGAASSEDTEALKEAIVPLTPSATAGDVGKFMKVKTVSGGKVAEYEFASAGGGGSVDLFYITPEQYGAVGDGETDDSEAVQAACDAGYAVCFGSNKTYYLAETVNIDHDCHLFGGKNTVIKTKTPTGGTVNDAIVVSGTLKKTTTLTSDYSREVSDTGNSVNKFTLSDMTGIEIGDIMVIKATDQYFAYTRQYYYLGATLLVTDIFDGHIYTNMGMEYDIENTNGVSVEVYAAPTVVVDGLQFESDLDSFGSYRRCLNLIHVKNSVIKNCRFSHMETGIYMKESVNTFVEGVTLSKSKYSNSMSGDGYGINIESCTQTVIRRINALAAQGCICLGGTIPVIDTFVYDSHLSAECRSVGFDTHENTINTVIEDCTLGGMSLYGTATVNRCRIFKNMRPEVSVSLALYGSHDPNRARFKVKDCVFEDSTGIIIGRPGVQNPVQAIQNVVGLVQIEGCSGGFVAYNPSTSQDVTSNTIEKLIIDKWDDCKYIYHVGTNGIKYIEITDTNFTNRYFITDYNESHGIVTTGINRIEIKNSKDRKHQTFIDKDTQSESVVLSKGAKINVSSNNNSAAFVVCGNELASDNPVDYFVGSVTGSAGGDPSRTKASGNNIPTLSSDGNGGIIWTQGSNTSKYSIYPVGLAYVKENAVIRMSAKIYNTGETSGETFVPYILIINGETKKIRERTNGSGVVATAEGAEITYNRNAEAGDLVACYYYCSSPANGGETTFKDMHASIEALFAPTPKADAYEANRRTGDGTITSIAGENNIMCSEINFHVNVQSDLMYNTSGW